jgi:threonine dehydratase
MVTLEDIQAARDRIRDAVHQTPLEQAEFLSQASGNEVRLKLENLQRTGSFKERGALNRILTLDSAEAEQGVICSSAGNHAQGVAFAAQRMGISATIVMPLATPLVKVATCKELGAEIILHGANYDEAYQHAQELQAQRGLTFVHPYDDPAVIAGQGTVGLEILEQWPELDVVVVPVGGGGLIAGIAVAVKSLRPGARVYGVEAARIAAMDASLAAGERVELPAARTLADGLATRSVGEHTFPLVQQHVDGIVKVEESEIASAILQLMEREKTVAEGGGAAGVAALAAERIPVQGQRVAVVLSGGNIDVNMLSRIIERGLVKNGRMVRLQAVLPDVPGALSELTRLVGACRANVVEIHHQRAFGQSEVGDTDLEMTLETRGFDHIDELLERLRAAGYPVRVTP